MLHTVSETGRQRIFRALLQVAAGGAAPRFLGSSSYFGSLSSALIHRFGMMRQRKRHNERGSMHAVSWTAD
ncbi:hypothetical protein [Rhizobium sp.]|uniref:hypothetical protein n=1 Tax=Rhizobium sp. TaxID=391 RepID=UPI0028AF3D17